MIILQVLKSICEELKEVMREVRRTQDMLDRIEQTGLTINIESDTDMSSESESEESEESVASATSAPF